MPPYDPQKDAYSRPRLIDYLQIASHESLTVELQLRLGAIACGRLAIREGRVIHADMPGASGELALELLGRVPNLRVEVGALGETETTVTRSWTSVLGSAGDQDEHASVRRAQVYAELRHFGLGGGSKELTSTTTAHSFSSLQLRRAQRVAATLLRRAGLLAYLGGDLDRARRCYERVLALRPRDIESRVNAERIRARMLDDEQLGRMESQSCD